MIKVLFVCLGNICRSPLAEAVFNKLVEEEGLENKIMSDSAGTSDYHIGEAPDQRTVDVAVHNKLRINHQARQFSKQDFSDFDYIIAMDRSNQKHIKSLLREQTQDRQQVFLMRDFEDDPDEPDVPDPYWSGKEGFLHVHRILFRSCKNLLNHIIGEHQLK